MNHKSVCYTDILFLLCFYINVKKIIKNIITLVGLQLGLSPQAIIKALPY